MNRCSVCKNPTSLNTIEPDGRCRACRWAGQKLNAARRKHDAEREKQLVVQAARQR